MKRLFSVSLLCMVWSAAAVEKPNIVFILADDHGFDALSGTGALFNLKKDPGETTDVSAAHPEVVEDLTRRMRAAMAELRQHSRAIGKRPGYSLEKARKLREQKSGY